MTNNPITTFTKQMTQLINESTTTTLPPLMGIITTAHSQYYADIHIEGIGTYTNVPCHGIPVVGDTAVIHFIEGKEELKYADCARRLAITEEELPYIFPETNECYNYLQNGDFRNGATNYEGNFQIIQNDAYITENNNNNSCILETSTGDTPNYIQQKVNIASCTSEYFKFQCYYKGVGTIQIQCIDTKTQALIPTQPTHNSHTTKTWKTDLGRFQWAYNKEVYSTIRDDGTRIEEILIKIVNNTEVELTIQDEEIITLPHAMTLDGLLVYDEGGSKEYYPNIKDVT